jgi:hypothetical protein
VEVALKGKNASLSVRTPQSLDLVSKNIIGFSGLIEF